MPVQALLVLLQLLLSSVLLPGQALQPPGSTWHLHRHATFAAAKRCLWLPACWSMHIACTAW